MKTVPPTTAEGIERYLGSGLVKGIGPILVKKLVLAERTEALVYILAHELRHMHQQHGHAVHSSFPVGWVKNSRGRFSEVDTEAFAIHKLRVWRRGTFRPSDSLLLKLLLDRRRTTQDTTTYAAGYNAMLLKSLRWSLFGLIWPINSRKTPTSAAILGRWVTQVKHCYWPPAGTAIKSSGDYPSAPTGFICCTTGSENCSCDSHHAIQ
jgi:hypothetical protein